MEGKVVFITGASRGIGESIAAKLAKEGASVAIVAQTTKEDSKKTGTIYSVAQKINETGGRAIALQCDIRDEDQITTAVQQTISLFGGIDILINNAAAISLLPTEEIDPQTYDQIQDINLRGTFMVTRKCIPFLKKSTNPHILNISPPIQLSAKWIAPHPLYTISKYSISLLTMGWAEELKKYGIAANSLWPATTIATSAIKNLPHGEMLWKRSRHPAILADATYHIVNQNAKENTGNFYIDENVLTANGITNLDQYAVSPGGRLQKDLYIP